MNAYYTYAGGVSPFTLARAEAISDQLAGITAGFDKLPSDPNALAQDRVTDLIATGTDTAMVATLGNLTVLTQGLRVTLVPPAASTGAATLNINGIGAVPIKRSDGSELYIGDLKAGAPVSLRYDGSVFRILAGLIPAKGDPGGSPASVGTYADLASGTMTIPIGIDVVETTGWGAKNDGGKARYLRAAVAGAAGNDASVPARCKAYTGGWWWILERQWRHAVEQFGMRADAVYSHDSGILTSGTNNGPILLDAEQFLTTINGTTLPAFSGELYFGANAKGFGTYYMGTQPYVPKRPAYISGPNQGRMPGSGVGDPVRLLWAAGITSINIPVWNGSVGGDGARIMGVTVAQLNTGFAAGAHGIKLHTRCDIVQCGFDFIGDTAIYGQVGYNGSGDTFGEANRQLVRDIEVHLSFGDGLNLGGADVNACLIENFETHTVYGCGIVNLPYYNNTFINILINGYGNGGVFYAGRAWGLAGPTGSGDTVQPGTNPAVWDDLGAYPAADTRFVQWVSGGHYKLQAPVYSPGTGSPFLGLYIEAQGVRAVIGGYVSLGSTAVCTNTSGDHRLSPTAGSFGETTTNFGFGAYRRFSPSDPGYVRAGAGAYAFVGAPSGNPAGGAIPSALRFGTALEGGEWQLNQDGSDIVFYNTALGFTSFGVTKLTTLMTGGTAATIPGKFFAADILLVDPTNSAGSRLFGIRGGVPISGNVAKGQSWINSNASAGGKAGLYTSTAGVAGSTAVIKPCNPVDP